MLMTRISESKTRSISAQCKPPGGTSSSNLQMAAIMVLIGILCHHPLLESDHAIFYLLKGESQEVNEETASSHKSSLL